MKLSRLFGLNVNNSTVHTNEACAHYSYIFNVIKLYKITLDELVKGSVNLIYKRIILNFNERQCNVIKDANYSICMFSKILPSYLQSFNFKLHNNYLPLNTLFRNYGLDNDTTCYFCGVGPESIFHVFGTCEKLKSLWKIASQSVNELTSATNFDFLKLRVNLILDFVNVKVNLRPKLFKTVIYFNSIINFSI